MILPSETSPTRWSPHHQRLHRHLLRHPELLPAGSSLLLAVSGGQDSMALTVLLADLRRLHHWRLVLWHGDHGWRAEAAQQAGELQAWAHTQKLPLLLEQAAEPPGGEAAARRWRYDFLRRQAAALAISHVVTGHTASDRAETLLLNLARGSHRRGLASLKPVRSLTAETGPELGRERESPGDGDRREPIRLVRPLLPFSREDTGRICRELEVPIWEDSSNLDTRFGRNRVRAEVMPVLEALHPGAVRRIGALTGRLEEELAAQDELVALALQGLIAAPGDSSRVLGRDGLGRLSRGNRRLLLERWLTLHGVPAQPARALEDLASRLAEQGGTGAWNLADGWQLRWDRSTLVLQLSAIRDPGHGPIPPGE
ncbi:MAG: tRNA lysidine(34) synthetase TilS [Cyanobacteria bacterium]|nr:tRNA lysidine(34) synthetase TilS [Cyanobacteriota bacterium]